MSKKKISFCADKIFWGLLMLLPLILLVVMVVKNGVAYNLADVFTNFGLGLDTSNSIYTTFLSIFGQGSSYISIFTDTGILLYITYIIIVECIHLLVDCLLYIPRIAMKWLDKGVE